MPRRNKFVLYARSIRKRNGWKNVEMENEWCFRQRFCTCRAILGHKIIRFVHKMCRYYWKKVWRQNYNFISICLCYSLCFRNYFKYRSSQNYIYIIQPLSSLIYSDFVRLRLKMLSNSHGNVICDLYSWNAVSTIPARIRKCIQELRVCTVWKNHNFYWKGH